MGPGKPEFADLQQTHKLPRTIGETGEQHLPQSSGTTYKNSRSRVKSHHNCNQARFLKANCKQQESSPAPETMAREPTWDPSCSGQLGQALLEHGYCLPENNSQRGAPSPRLVPCRLPAGIVGAKQATNLLLPGWCTRKQDPHL